ncbi:MAG: GTP cyclohydrolase I [Microbacteriaceae bacterium]|nr:GTP cyclohydrolase I [Microbacteriaceae bacterium]
MHEVQEAPLTAHERGEAAVAVLLESLGYDVESERLRATPARVAATLASLVRREPLPPVTLIDAEGYDGPIVLRDIPFHSLCEHHLLPFRGVAHVGYRPADRVAGLSTLARVVEYFARDLQLQERMTADIADWVERELEPRGVGVAIDAEHLCMSMRGVGTPGTRARTEIFRGAFSRSDIEMQERVP